MNGKNILVGIILLAIIFSSGLVAGQFVEFRLKDEPATTSIKTVTITTIVATKTVTSTIATEEGSLTPTELFESVEDSVVSIFVILPDGSAQGSGFVFDNQGHIVTNNHVVEGATSISVTFLDGTSVEAELIGRDVYSDLAVIKVESASKTLKPISLGNSSALKVGEQVAAIGNPFGLSGSMTLGIVSQLGRSSQILGGYSLIDLIQIDAAVNPGNSGGPLLNMMSEVVGVNTLILSRSGASEGVGLAIPSNMINRVANSLIETGSYKHPWVGIQGTDVTPGIAEAMNLPEAKGFLIIQVLPGSPAEKAGLRGGDQEVSIDGLTLVVGGDVITGVDDIDARQLNELLLYTERYKSPGDTLTFKVFREGKVQSIDLVLGERPPPG
ncbi:MAG: trypsin-like peptidase domain-containing protein [Nitrososphaerales archaeon]